MSRAIQLHVRMAYTVLGRSYTVNKYYFWIGFWVIKIDLKNPDYKTHCEGCKVRFFFKDARRGFLI